MAYVYRHIRTDKNVPFYIGIGTDKTFKRAKEKSRRSELWKKVAVKGDYDIEILFDGISWEDAKKKEQEFIKMYGRIDLKTGTLCNMTDGGDGTLNKIFSKEYRAKLSAKAKSRVVSDAQKQKLREYRVGVKNSEESNLKRKITMTGRQFSKSHTEALSKVKTGEKNPMYGVKGDQNKNFKGYILAFKDGIYFGKYAGVRNCAASLNITATKISAVITGRRNTVAGFTFTRISNGKII